MFSQTNSQNGRSIPLDALRGFALFGVLVANLFIFNSYTGDLHIYLNAFPDTLNQLTGTAVQYFFRGRFYPIFTFLFGVGLGMQYLKQKATEAGIKLLLRRLFVLLLIGILHYVLVWDGDILIRYSLVGFVALAFLKLRKELILTAAVLVYFLHSLYALQVSTAPALSAFLQHETIVKQNYLQLLLFRLKGLPMSYGTIESLFYSIKILSFVLFGLYFSKQFIFWRNNKFWFRTLVVLVMLRITTATITYINQGTEGIIFTSFISYLLNPAIYVAAFMLFANSGLMYRITAVLSCVGRMSLTNYLLQNLVLAFIFYGYGLDQYQEWQPWQLVLFAVLFFIVQGYMSRWWLRHHTQGPVEKVWRYFTYELATRKAQLK